MKKLISFTLTIIAVLSIFFSQEILLELIGNTVSSYNHPLEEKDEREDDSKKEKEELEEEKREYENKHLLYFSSHPSCYFPLKTLWAVYNNNGVLFSNNQGSYPSLPFYILHQSLRIDC